MRLILLIKRANPHHDHGLTQTTELLIDSLLIWVVRCQHFPHIMCGHHPSIVREVVEVKDYQASFGDQVTSAIVLISPQQHSVESKQGLRSVE